MESLESKSRDGIEEPKIVLQRWYPRVWDSWARRSDQAAVVQLESDTRSVDVGENKRQLHLRTLAPKFMSRSGSSSKASFANMIDLKFYGTKELVAEVIPDGEYTLARAIGGIGIEEWRFSKSGMTYLSSHKGLVHSSRNSRCGKRVHRVVLGSTIGRCRCRRPVVSRSRRAWLWGGIWGLGTLTDEGIVKLLDKMSDGRSMRKKAFLGELARVANERKFPLEAERLAKRVTGGPDVPTGCGGSVSRMYTAFLV